MCPGSIWEGPGSFRSSKTMFLNGFQLVNLMKFDNTKFDQVGIETDPGRRQERRKQYAFGVQFVFFLFLCVLIFTLNDILGFFWGQNVESEKCDRSFGLRIVFLPSLCYFNAERTHQTPDLWI